MFKKAIVAAALTLSAGMASAQPSEKAGWYAGLDLGRSRLGMSGSDFDGALGNQGIAASSSNDDSATSYGINGGYRFNRNFAVEGAYAHLGSFDTSATTPTDTLHGKFKANALSLAGVGILPFTPNWSAYGKAGVSYNMSDLDMSSDTGATAVENHSHSSTGLLVGAGLRYDFDNSLFTKVGWDHYAGLGDESTGKGSIDLFSVGIGMNF